MGFLSFSVALRASIRALAVVSLVAPALSAQSTVPQVRINGVNTVMSLAQWPGVSTKVDDEANVVVFAVTQGRRDIPLQILSPRRPGLESRIRAGRTVQARSLDRRELLHLVNYGEAPLVVAFASQSKPDLDQFRFGPDWADDMLLDTLATSQEEMVQILGKTIFGAEAEFSVAVATAANPTPLSRFAESWYFDNGCTGYASYYWRRSGLGWFGGSMYNDIDPIVRNAFGYGLAGGVFGFGFGGTYMLHGAMFSLMAPITIGGQMCTGYRVAWWPSVQYPVQRVGMVNVPQPTPEATPVTPAPDGSDPLKPTEPQPTAPTPGFEASAWRRGETGSARRFPAVTADERPWNSRALPSQLGSNRSDDAGSREAARRRTDPQHDRTNWSSRSGATGSQASDASSARGSSPTRGREFPTGGAGTATGTGRAQSEAPRPAPAPRSDGTIIPPTPSGQTGTGSSGSSGGTP
jgi:hypothetical protein